jgi:hypothetical protein
MSLGICLDCRRHARASEAACPFCGGTVQPPVVRRVAAGTALTRAVLLGATLSAAGCDFTSAQPVYGAPIPADSGASDSGADGDVSAQPLYGAPVVDAGADAAMMEETGPMADYGAPPPPPDAGSDAR